MKGEKNKEELTAKLSQLRAAFRESEELFDLVVDAELASFMFDVDPDDTNSINAMVESVTEAILVYRKAIQKRLSEGCVEIPVRVLVFLNCAIVAKGVEIMIDK